MRKISVILGLLMSVSQMSAQEAGTATKEDHSVSWMSIEEAISDSTMQQQYIFIDFYTSWCGWCKTLDRTTFKDERLVDYLTTYYLPVKFDAELKEKLVFMGRTFINTNPKSSHSAHQLAAFLLKGRMNYPSMLIMDRSGNVLQSFSGYKNADELLVILKYYASEAYQRMEFKEFQEFEGK